MDSVWQNPIQKTAHLSVLIIVHNCRTQHTATLVIFLLNLQTSITAQILSTGGEEVLSLGISGFIQVRCPSSHTTKCQSMDHNQHKSPTGHSFLCPPANSFINMKLHSLRLAIRHSQAKCMVMPVVCVCVCVCPSQHAYITAHLTKLWAMYRVPTSCALLGRFATVVQVSLLGNIYILCEMSVRTDVLVVSPVKLVTKFSWLQIHTSSDATA